MLTETQRLKLFLLRESERIETGKPLTTIADMRTMCNPSRISV